jgi:hypothetical protein
MSFLNLLQNFYFSTSVFNTKINNGKLKKKEPTFFIIFLLGVQVGVGLSILSFISRAIRSPSVHLQNLNPL